MVYEVSILCIIFLYILIFKVIFEKFSPFLQSNQFLSFSIKFLSKIQGSYFCPVRNVPSGMQMTIKDLVVVFLKHVNVLVLIIFSLFG